MNALSRELKLEVYVSWKDISQMILSHVNLLIHSVNTCYWKLGRPVYQTKNPPHLPCGPRSEMLLEMNQPARFIAGALKNKGMYGNHGMATLLAAYHGNLLVTMEDGRKLPTSLESWRAYDELIDQNPLFKMEAEEGLVVLESNFMIISASKNAAGLAEETSNG